MTGDFAGVFILFFLIWAAAIGLMIWALVDAVRVPDDSLYRSGSKVVWVLVIVFLGPIGAIIYLAAGRPPPEMRNVRWAAPSFPGATSIDYRGLRYALGRAGDGYAIWDSAAGGAMIRTFPLTEEGWREAWRTYYEELEGAPPPPAPPASQPQG